MEDTRAGMTPMPPPPGCLAPAPRGAVVTQDPGLLDDQAECWNQVLLVIGDMMRSASTPPASVDYP